MTQSYLGPGAGSQMAHISFPMDSRSIEAAKRFMFARCETIELRGLSKLGKNAMFSSFSSPVCVIAAENRSVLLASKGELNQITIGLDTPTS